MARLEQPPYQPVEHIIQRYIESGYAPYCLKIWHDTRELAQIAFLFHDIEKLWKYDIGSDGQLYVKPELVSKKAQHALKMAKLEEYGLVITPEIENGIKYAEGELNDYSSRRRVMLPIAAFVHTVDVWSARICFNHPFEHDDPWAGAQRFRD